MEQGQLTWITNFIWGIADDVLRDLYVRGKYRDVILPMTVLRRLNVVLEPNKRAVLEMKAALDQAGIVNQERALRQAAGQDFYNTSRFTLRDLRARASQQQLRADFEAYLDGFAPSVQDILENFEFRNQIPRLSKADALGTLIEKFLSPDINLSPNPVFNGDGSVKHPGLDNHAMGTIFEELVRRFNEENNEEAGEHWTPRDAVKLMAKLIFLPIAGEIRSGTYLLYDGACGTGGMLTVAEETLKELAAAHGKQVATHLYGQEINAETYAICKADLLLKGEGDAADNIVGGPEHSTLSNDAFRARAFDFMLSNPPYGKSWKSDLERLGGKGSIKDPRFVIEHAGAPEYSLLTRSSDGQMLFLANMLNKMKHDTPLGSRIAEVHNGSSLFTGDAGHGESNIRRWIVENDWLEAIVALPLNMFYNTGIATYVWVLTNRKPAQRRGTVQLIDATQWYRPLRKNLGKKNCELSEEDTGRICDTFLRFEESEQSKIFPNAAFGYWKVTVERPLRLTGADPNRAYAAKEIKELRASSQRADDAPPVIKKIHKKGTAPDPLRGLFLLPSPSERGAGGEGTVVEYEPDPDLRDTEQIPLLEPGGIDAFLRREVLPHAPDAWYDPGSVKTGYEISHALFLQAAAASHLGRDPRGYSGFGAGDGRAAGRDLRRWDAMTTDLPEAASTPQLLADIRLMSEETRSAVASTVNAGLTLLYWRIGKRINDDVLQGERAEYGKHIVATLSNQLVGDFGNNFAEKNLRRMMQFAEVFPEEQIVVSLIRQLSWTHFLALLPLKQPLQREFYAEMCRVERWSVRTLRRQIASMLYERTALSRKPDELIQAELEKLREDDRLSPDMVFKDPYFLDFLGIRDHYYERDLEDAILREIEAFLLELGSGFAFLARQKRIQLDGDDFYIDLLFYNRRLRRLVALDLKLDDFRPGDKGQMELYLRWLNRYERQPGEETPLGIILCAGKKQEQVELLELGQSGIHVAEYLTELPPRELLQQKLHAAIVQARARLALREARDA